MKQISLRQWMAQTPMEPVVRDEVELTMPDKAPHAHAKPITPKDSHDSTK